MADTLKLKFKHSLPLHMEHALVNKYGFVIESRVPPDGLVVTRKRPKPHAKVRLLTDAKKLELEKRCRVVASFFNAPERDIGNLRTRLHNLSQTLSNPFERKFVNDLIEKEWPEKKVIVLS
jgi:hypothetical protein